MENFWIFVAEEFWILGFNSLMAAASMDLSVAEAVCKVCLSSTDFGTPFCFKKESEIRQLGIRVLTGLRTSNWHRAGVPESSTLSTLARRAGSSLKKVYAADFGSMHGTSWHWEPPIFCQKLRVILVSPCATKV